MRHRRIPRTTSAVPPSLRPWPAIALLIVSTSVDVAWGRGGSVSQPRRREAEHQRLEQTLRALFKDRLPGFFAKATAPADDGEDATPPCTSDDPPSPPDEPPEVAMFISVLTEVFSMPDDYLGWTMLDEILDDGSTTPEAAPLLLAALEAPSPNIRARALDYFADLAEPLEDALPLLESLWEGGLPDWARTDLIAALARQESPSHLEDFLALTSDPDPLVRLAAIDALTELPGEEALERLLELARTGERSERRVALLGVGSHTSSEKALATVLAAAREDDPLESQAIGLLTGFPQSEAEERLLEYIRGVGVDPELKLQAAKGMVYSEQPGVTDALLDLLDRPEVQETSTHVLRVLEMLRDRGDPAAVPRLREQAQARGGDGSDYGVLSRYLTGEADEAPKWTIVSCEVASLDVDGPSTWHVVAPRGRGSVRCSDGPGMPGESWLESRIHDGALVTIEKRFDRDETWARLGFGDAEGCWVPQRFLERGAGPEVWPIDPDAPELDLPAEALAPRAVRRLIRKGAIEPFDSEAGVVGVVLHPRVGGPTIEDLFAALQDGPGIAAADRMDDILDEIEEAAEEAAIDASDRSGEDEEEDD